MKNKILLSILSISILVPGAAAVLLSQKSVTANYDFQGSKVTLGSVKKLSNAGTVTYSPDGNGYIIQKNKDLYLVENGKEKHIAHNAAHAAWSPDGNTIVFANAPTDTATATDLWSYDLKKERKQHAGKTDKPFRFSLNKEGKVISSNKTGIEQTDTTTQTTKTLAVLDAEDYRVSPDNKWIAFVNATTLSLFEITTGNTTLISANLNPRHWDDFAWSTDSLQLAYLNHLPGKTASIMTYDIQNSSSETIYTTAENGFYAGVNWLKNNHLIYQFVPLRNSDASANARYEVLNPVAPQPVVLFKNGLGLRLSEDGKKITFIRDHDQSASPYMAELKY